MNYLHAAITAGLVLSLGSPSCNKTATTQDKVVALLQKVPQGDFILNPDNDDVMRVGTSKNWLCVESKKGVFCDFNGDGKEDESGDSKTGTEELLTALQKLDVSKPYKQENRQIPEAVWLGKNHVISPYTGEYIDLSGCDIPADKILICPYSGKQFKIFGASPKTPLVENQLAYRHPLSAQNVRVAE